MGCMLLVLVSCTSRTDAPIATVPPPEPAPRQTLDRPPVTTLFTDIADAVGIEFRRYDGEQGLHRIAEANGGGVALFDFDLDGRLDVFLTQGCDWPPGEDSPRCALYRNIAGPGGLQFREVGAVAQGMKPAFFQGCAVGDFDGDGFEDLYLTAFGRHELWKNLGDGTFLEQARDVGIDVQAWGSSAAFCDLNRDGVLDLFVVNYLQESLDKPTLCPETGSPDGYAQCAPALFVGADNRLFLGDGTGHFRDATRESLADVARGKGLGIAVFDANEDGWPDVFVANDGVPNSLLMQTPSQSSGTSSLQTPRFTDEASLRGAAVDRQGLAVAGMGVAAADYDRDDSTDLAVTTFLAEPTLVLKNRAGMFIDSSAASGLGLPTISTLGFGIDFLDCDNDGWLDLLIANGHVDDLSWRGTQFRMPAQLFRNESGRFWEVSADSGDYFSQPHLGRGLAIGDLDGDGDQDAVISNQRERAALLRNDTPGGNQSLQLKLVGLTSSRSSVGARVEVQSATGKQTRELIGGGSFQSASDRVLHFGLGRGPVTCDVHITWPAGTETSWKGISPGRYVVIESGKLLRSDCIHKAD
jgi:hypothetical protein